MTYSSVIKDPCPLGCGRAFHGLPQEASGPRPDCPGPWDATPKAPEQEVE